MPLLQYDIEKNRRTLDFRRLGIANLLPSRYEGGLTASPYSRLIDDRGVRAPGGTTSPLFRVINQQGKRAAFVDAQNYKTSQKTYKIDLSTNLFTQRQFKVIKAQANITVPHLKKTEKFQTNLLKAVKDQIDTAKDTLRETVQKNQDILVTLKSLLSRSKKQESSDGLVSNAIKGATYGTASVVTAGALSRIFPTFSKLLRLPKAAVGATGNFVKGIPGAAAAGTKLAGAGARIAAKGGTVGRLALSSAKLAGRGASYFVPGLGLAVGLGGAAEAFSKGDILSTLTRGAGAAASVIPGLGPFVGLAIDAIGELIPDAVRDTFNKIAGPIITKMVKKTGEAIRFFFTDTMGFSGPVFDGIVKVFNFLVVDTFKTMYGVFEDIMRILKSPVVTKVLLPAIFGLLTTMSTGFLAAFKLSAKVFKSITGFLADLAEGKGLSVAFEDNVAKPIREVFVSIGKFFSSDNIYKMVRDSLPPGLQWAADTAFFGTALTQKQAASSENFLKSVELAKAGTVTDPRRAVELISSEYNRIIGSLDPKTHGDVIRQLIAERTKIAQEFKDAPSRFNTKQAILSASEALEKVRNSLQTTATKLTSTVSTAASTTEAIGKSLTETAETVSKTAEEATKSLEKTVEETSKSLEQTVQTTTTVLQQALEKLPGGLSELFPDIDSNPFLKGAMGFLGELGGLAQSALGQAQAQAGSLSAELASIQGLAGAAFSEAKNITTGTAQALAGQIALGAEMVKSGLGAPGSTVQNMTSGTAGAVAGQVAQGAEMVKSGLGVKPAKIQWSSAKSATLEANLAETAQKSGVSLNYLRTMAYIESQGDTNAVSPTGAKGIFQFTRGTGEQYGLVGPGKDIRANEKANVEAGARLAKDNATALRKMGVEPTPAMLYLAHQQGIGGVQQLMAAVRGGPVSRKLRYHMDVNGGRGLSPAQFIEKWQRDYQAIEAGVTGGNQVASPVSMAASVGSSVSNASASLGATASNQTGPTTTQIVGTVGNVINSSPELLQGAKSEFLNISSGMRQAVAEQFAKVPLALQEQYGASRTQNEMLQVLQRTEEYQREMANRDSQNAALEAMNTPRDPTMELLAGFL